MPDGHLVKMNISIRPPPLADIASTPPTSEDIPVHGIITVDSGHVVGIPMGFYADIPRIPLIARELLISNTSTATI